MITCGVWRVVLHRFDHRLVLLGSYGHHHPSGVANALVSNIAVTGDLVASVDDNDSARASEDARNLAQQHRLADARDSDKEDGLENCYPFNTWGAEVIWCPQGVHKVSTRCPLLLFPGLYHEIRGSAEALTSPLSCVGTLLFYVNKNAL